ncbi:MAG: response regulator transcription factor [Cyclobacteriaceae bacterium]|nr:response regulator transcription factor [Cyclobacteriaceae bacterium]
MNDKEVKILLVDDHVIVRNGMKLLIESVFSIAQIYDVENGNIALDLIGKIKFDIVITDITMPGMSGIELCKKAMEKDSSIKFLMISMHLDEAYIKEAIESGAKGYLTKSMDSEMEIILAIETILKGNIFYGKKTSQILLNGMSFDVNSKLTAQEIKVVRFLSDGLAYREMAYKMNVSTRTVTTYRNNILQKLNMRNNADIIKYAIKHKLISLE